MGSNGNYLMNPTGLAIEVDNFERCQKTKNQSIFLDLTLHLYDHLDRPNGNYLMSPTA